MSYRKVNAAVVDSVILGMGSLAADGSGIEQILTGLEPPPLK